MDSTEKQKTFLENKYVLLFLFIIIVFVNLISSIHFLNIMLVGVAFIAYTRCLNSKNYYPMIYTILAILFIELNNGFRPFSILLLGSFIYIFLIPYLTRVMVIDSLKDILQIILLYVGIFMIFSLIHGINYDLLKILALNLVIDAIIIGLAP